MHCQAQGIACGFDTKTTILKDISFSVDQGTMTAIVGVNGVGKSTLLRALAGITQPHAGVVTVNGHDIHKIRAKKRAMMLTFVGQEEQPPADLSVEEVVALGRLPYIKSWQLGSKNERDIVEHSLDLVGLAGRRKALCSELSGGQRRRVLLARGFAQQTDLVFLDEPTNHLDVRHQLHLLHVLRDSGRTIVATIHDLDLAVSHFDQVVVVGNGGVVAAGSPQEVLTPEIVSQVFGVESLLVQLEQARRVHLLIDALSHQPHLSPKE